MRRIALIEIEDSAGQLIRLHLEHLGYQVALNRPGKPSDVFAAFSFFGSPADVAILCAHGDDKGIVFPEMAQGVDDLVLPGGRISPALIRERLTGAPPLVISTACATGTAVFADAFYAAGATTWLAPQGDPLGRDIPLFIAALLHAPNELPAALERANALVDPQSRFAIFA